MPVIADFGEVPPFIRIRAAEARHVDALRILFARYGVPVPENPWPGRVARCGSLQEACAAGVVAEIDNAALYEGLLTATQRPDICVVFRNLRGEGLAAASPACLRALCPRGDGSRCRWSWNGRCRSGTALAPRRRGRMPLSGPAAFAAACVNEACLG
jgi:hypothetical protein